MNDRLIKHQGECNNNHVKSRDINYKLNNDLINIELNQDTLTSELIILQAELLVETNTNNETTINEILIRVEKLENSKSKVERVDTDIIKENEHSRAKITNDRSINLNAENKQPYLNSSVRAELYSKLLSRW